MLSKFEPRVIAIGPDIIHSDISRHFQTMTYPYEGRKRAKIRKNQAETILSRIKLRVMVQGRRVSGRTVRQTGRRADGRTDGRTDRQTDTQTDGWMNGWMDGRTDGRTDGRMDGWMDR